MARLRPWTNEESSLLLELFLLQKSSYRIIAHKLERPFNGVDTKIRKLAMCYKTEEAYEPSNRTRRDVYPWSARDAYIYKIWLDNDRKGGLEHLAKVLARSIENIQRYTVPNYGRRSFDL